MCDLSELQTSLNSNSPEILAQCPTIIAKMLINMKSDVITNIVLPAIKMLLSSSFDTVSDAMLQTLPYICKTIQKLMPINSIDYIFQNILPIFNAMTDDDNEDTISLAADAITAIIEQMKNNEFDFKFAKFLQTLAVNNKKTVRAVAALTLEYCAEVIDINPTFEIYSQIVVDFATDSSSAIRSRVPSIVTAHIDLITNPLNVSLFSSQMLLLSHDKSLNVRKSVIECLFDFSQKVSCNERVLIVQPVLCTLLDDQNSQIRLLLLARFAPIINTIGKSVSQDLIQKYCYFLLSDHENQAFSVAFSFSAVALGIGADRFHQELFPSFTRALQSFDNRVRRTLSFSLTTFSHLFNPSELCETVCTLLKDMPFVSIGVVSNLSDILPHVDDKESLLFCLLNPSAKYSEWRMRLKVSEQLRKCQNFFDREELLDSAMELVEDEVAVVRKDAVISFASLMEKKDMPKLKELATNENHWIRLCAAQIIGQKNWDDKQTKEILKILRKDSVYAVQKEANSVHNRMGFF
ncbi:HEAT repeat family protein [Tritrichomonas foetus]|uniref:HEAT repeat family protein n=1 Tax=Tritrichomonas foetus TaxID=1144522 RepID=A0A1J4JM34_9EUKA|nr:HEAT repeat family protein [Tritrichomonas foetus]|eukprot:OHT00131.1 HEAT repeat family protein [Tritrichomonas foetus]